MRKVSILAGVYAAMVTPLKPDLTPDMDGVARLLQFLANRGCHGVLLSGTTGEGPSLSREERLLIYQIAAEVRQDLPDFRLMAGTGTPSLEDTIFLTQAVFQLGFDGVVVLPPYYYRKASDDGLFSWFKELIYKAVPEDGMLFGYHIPAISGVSLSLDLLTRLKETYPTQFAGIKDSSGDPDWSRALGKRFGPDLLVLNGNDRLFTLAMQSNAAGCITAMANLLSPLLRQIWDNYQAGDSDEITQDKVSAAREVLDRYTPFPPLIKMMLAHLHGFNSWKVKPPLSDFDPAHEEIVLSEFLAALE